MRRPLKPFVTEYKGGRRPAFNQSQHLDTPRESAPPGHGSTGSNASTGTGHRTSSPSGPWPSGLWPSDNEAISTDRPRPRHVEMRGTADPEDAYEAALRAADALFTRTVPEQKPTAPASPPLPGATPAAEATPSQAEQVAPERGGRILQVIDEAPPPQFAALEAAYAPKRRGRKPGSKNKPKETALKIEPETDLPSGPTPPLFAHILRPAGGDEAPDHRTTAVAADLAAVSMAPPPAIPALEATAVRGPRRAGRMANERAKPGEGWKRRRLPRVCW